jgi:radical SAM superfamily enzyme
MGIESGCDEVLDNMKKGVTRVEHLDGGKKMREAGINVAAFIMPGMAGADTAMSEIHIRETTSLLNETRPTEVRIRSIAVVEHSPLYKLYREGVFTPAAEDQMIEEIRMLLNGLNFDCVVETYQMTNVLFNIKENLKEKKNELILLIDKYLNFSPLDRARFRLNRYLSGGYVNYLKAVRKYSATVAGLIDDAQKAIKRGSPDAIEKVDRAIFAIKSKGVP